VVQDGIYFISKSASGGEYVIQFLHLATGRIRPVVPIGKVLPSGLAVSPDGQWFLYPQLDQAGSDLMLMENFH
jgi:hypothetical protein